MNSLTILTLLACFFCGYFTGWYGWLTCRDKVRGEHVKRDDDP